LAQQISHVRIILDHQDLPGAAGFGRRGGLGYLLGRRR
jgi:hypothetical protein